MKLFLKDGDVVISAYDTEKSVIYNMSKVYDDVFNIDEIEENAALCADLSFSSGMLNSQSETKYHLINSELFMRDSWVLSI